MEKAGRPEDQKPAKKEMKRQGKSSDEDSLPEKRSKSAEVVFTALCLTCLCSFVGK